MAIRIIILAALTALVLGACGGGTPGNGSPDGVGDLFVPDGAQAEVDQGSQDLGPDQTPPKDVPDLADTPQNDLPDVGELPDQAETRDGMDPYPDADGTGSDVVAAPMPPRFLILGNPAGGGFMRTGSLSLTFQIGPSSAGQMRSPNAKLVGPMLLMSR